MSAKISKLHSLIEETREIQDFDKRKCRTLDLVEELEIRTIDKKKMINEVAKGQSSTRLDFYLYNALLKFEGLGVI